MARRRDPTTPAPGADAHGQLLRAHGLRRTPARVAVLEALAGAGEHPSADDVAARAQALDPGLHRSTVYRTLDSFEQAGLVVHAHLGHGRATYHLAGASHAHAACEHCGTAFEVPGEVLEPVRSWLAAEHDFALDARHFALTGTCASCAAQPGRSRRAARAGAPA